jgi:hypothetical protein
MNPIALPILLRIPLGCHPRESGGPERIEKAGFLLLQERRAEIENDFFRKQLIGLHPEIQIIPLPLERLCRNWVKGAENIDCSLKTA